MNSIDIELYNYIVARFKEKYSVYIDDKSLRYADYSFPKTSKVKRKLSNFYIGKCLQPFLEKRVERGY